MNRRTFLKIAGSAGGAGLVVTRTAHAAPVRSEDGYGVLVDLTECAGCRTCEEACAEANSLPSPDSDDVEPPRVRDTSDKQWLVVNERRTDNGSVFVRRQCMHCLDPACAAACPTRALTRTQNGPVIWVEDRCLGCRFCMVSCPFDIPKFEYSSRVPRIQKCRMCWERLRAGKEPACVEACPAGALTFGKRRDLLQTARSRILGDPKKYIPKVYGEHEVGGTSWMYLSGVRWEDVGLRTDLGDTSYPGYTRGFLAAVPIVLTLWPAMLLALRQSTAPAGDRGSEPESPPRGEEP